MQLRGVPDQKTPVYPKDIPAEAPAYTPAFVVGDYTKTELGSTPAGTRLVVWTRPGELEAMLDGTSHLVETFGFLEKTYGPYTFGDEAGSVSVEWGEEYGGMENHPLWHISGMALRSQEVHTHEAAHGWFGTGVRFACWEDFVLSEGTTSYISGRALEEVGGPDLFDTYVAEMDLFCGTKGDVRALPDTCNEIDITTDPLWSMVPYMKGACFYEDVADQIGVARMDTIIASFYQKHVGTAVHMEDMLDAIRSELSPEEQAPFEERVEDWLLSPKCPADYAERCGRHGN
jgi:aminopeptidase N